MLKLKLISTLLILSITITLVAQKPAWTDYYKRSEMYPEGEFLTGYISGVNTNEKDPGELKIMYESLAKDMLIQSIQVEIESNNSLNNSNVNGVSSEAFISKSVSFSKAKVAGLATLSYYDRKKHEVFAVAYINKKELAFYYRNLIKSGQEDIEQKLLEGKQFSSKGKKEKALTCFYGAMPKILQIDEARTLLIALNRKMYADINMDEINNLKLEIDNELNSLLNPTKLNIAEAAYFAAYGLHLQLGEIGSKLFVDTFSYENTGLSSEFSEKWIQAFTSSMVEIGNYEVVSKTGYSNTITIYGNYWTEGGLIKVSASATKNSDLIAVSKGSLTLSWIKSEDINYLPVQIELMNNLKGINIIVEEAPSTVKLGTSSTKPIKIRIESAESSNKIVGIPIQITNSENGEVLCSVKTNDEGISLCYLPAIQSNSRVFVANVSVNLSEYLDINRNSLFYPISNRQNPVSSVALNFTTEKPTICIVSKELIQGRPMDIKTLEPIIKEVLAEKGYNFVANKSDADYEIIINANTTTGSQYQGIYFAFLDINLSIVDNTSGEEVYKTHIDQVKGGGSNYSKAGKKAYMTGASKLKESLLSSSL